MTNQHILGSSFIGGLNITREMLLKCIVQKRNKNCQHFFSLMFLLLLQGPGTVVTTMRHASKIMSDFTNKIKSFRVVSNVLL